MQSRSAPRLLGLALPLLLGLTLLFPAIAPAQVLVAAELVGTQEEASADLIEGDPIEGDPIEVLPPATLVAPWEIPPEALRTQRLYRMELEAGKRSGSLRLTLRLAEPDEFLLTAVDPLGRRLWTLQVDGERMVWLDHRREVVCRGEDAPPPFLGGLTLAGLPAALLGRLPEPPSEREPVQWWRLDDGQRQLRYVDRNLRQWSARVDAEGELRTWSSRLDPRLLTGEDGEAGASAQEDVVRWQLEERGATLRDPRRQLEARWRETLREPLPAGAVLEPVIAGDYREVECGFDRRTLEERMLQDPALEDEVFSHVLPDDTPPDP